MRIPRVQEAPGWDNSGGASTFNSVQAAQSSSLPVSGVLPRYVPLPSVQFQFASFRSFPKHEFASLKFWKSIKTGHILGSFCQKQRTCKRPSQALRHENISYHDIFM